MNPTKRTTLPHLLNNLLMLSMLFICVSNASERNTDINDNRVNKIRSNLPRRRPPTEMCPPEFMRLGNKCIFLSQTSASWTEAFHKCRDMKGELITLEQAFEDRRLKQFLQKDGRQVERWIGGIFNGQHWTWGASGRIFSYEGFSKMRPPNVTADEKLFCVAMDPRKNYRWTAKSCIEPSLYICQTKQARSMNPRVRKPSQRRSNRYPSTNNLDDNLIIPHNRQKYQKPHENYSNALQHAHEQNLKNYRLNLNQPFSDTQNDIDPSNNELSIKKHREIAAAAYRKSETRKRISLLNRVTRRCQNRDATVLKHLNSTKLSENDCIQFFIQRWNRKQKKHNRDNRTINYSKAANLKSLRLIDRVTPKTIIKSRSSELHPAEIVETHDVWVA